MKTIIFGSLCLAFGFVVACSSGPTSNAVTGTVAGTSLSAQDAVFSNTTAGTGTVVGVTSFGGACTDLANDQLPKSSVVLSLQLAQGTGSVTNPGTFSFLGTQGATAAFAAEWTSYDSTCTPTNSMATGGTVTVDSVSSSQLTGTFDIKFNTDHVTGSFVASTCAAIGTGSGSPTCI